jgi:hypothetical protein
LCRRHYLEATEPARTRKMSITQHGC